MTLRGHQLNERKAEKLQIIGPIMTKGSFKYQTKEVKNVHHKLHNAFVISGVQAGEHVIGSLTLFLASDWKASCWYFERDI